MGGAVSSGCDNDDLIDKLKEKDYIKSKDVEQVFRMVDRAHYYLEEARDSAYEDLAWKNGTLHLSAPCIYSKVMEALELKKGMSFLNLGSGTGYLSTMVGFSIGPYGINHGVELHAENVAYARKRLVEFVESAPRYDDLELCEPEFVVGNCLSLAPDNRLYDRVYCGAACPMEQLEVLQHMIKVGGILVTPVEDQLLKLRRLSDTEFTSENVLPVSFASLVVPRARQVTDEAIIMPKVNPMSLQSISRIVIREAIRSTFEFSLPTSKSSKSRQKSKEADSDDDSLQLDNDAAFSIVPARELTRDGVMIMRIGGRMFQGRSHLVLPFREIASGMGASATTASDSDNNDAADEDFNNDEEDEEEDDMESDFQDRAAQALQRLKEKSATSKMALSRSDVDSDLSDDEAAGNNISFFDAQDINGNSTKRVGGTAKKTAETDVKSRSNQDTSENLAGASSSSNHHGRSNLSIPRKKKKVSVGTRSALAARPHSPEQDKRYKIEEERFSPPILVQDHGVSSQKQDDCGPQCEVSSQNRFYWNKKHSASLSSDDGFVLSGVAEDQEMEAEDSAGLNHSSLVIDVPTNSSSTKPCKIQKQFSYSTSAETSVTSGFGSLGDEPSHLLGSFKEEESSGIASDFFEASLPEINSHLQSDRSTESKRDTTDDHLQLPFHAPWKKPTKTLNASKAMNDVVDADIEDLSSNSLQEEQTRSAIESNTVQSVAAASENGPDPGDTDSDMTMQRMLARFSKLVEREEGNSSSADTDEDNDGGAESEAENQDDNESNKSQDFSVFLREKVETLPIPNSIKAFILHYREKDQ